MEKLVLGIIGGGLIAYGIMAKSKKVKDPNNQFVDLPDKSAQTDGNISLVIGIIFIIGTLVA